MKHIQSFEHRYFSLDDIKKGTHYYSNLPGNSDLEKCVEMCKREGFNFQRYDINYNGDDITCIVGGGDVEIFDKLGEKIKHIYKVDIDMDFGTNWTINSEQELITILNSFI